MPRKRSDKRKTQTDGLSDEERAFADDFLASACTDEWIEDPDAGVQYQLAVTLRGYSDRRSMHRYMFQQASTDSDAALSFVRLLRVERDPETQSELAGLALLAVAKHLERPLDAVGVLAQEVLLRASIAPTQPHDADDSIDPGSWKALAAGMHEDAGNILRGILDLGDVRVVELLPIPSRMLAAGREALFRSPLTPAASFVFYAARWLEEAELHTCEEASEVMDALAEADFDHLDSIELGPLSGADFDHRTAPSFSKAALANRLASSAGQTEDPMRRDLLLNLAQRMQPN